ncbi:MAG TPA: dTDP-glucose 4,6-dehydratase [Gemmatales bacterium]|nr:dTDP-glucose 4,6-dehydratase [Gemmatales bacterium]
MHQVVITGGCGFIGSNLIRWILSNRKDWHVINLDKLTYAGNLENLADVSQSDHYQFIHGDITDRNLVEKVIHSKVAAVFHLAAESHVDRSILDAGPFIQTNIVGTQVLLDVSRSIGLKRFVQVSTDEVYGSLGPTGLFTEETPLSPNSPYSASKAAADLLVRSYHHTYGMDVVTTRCSNNYGPYQFPEKLIPLFVTNLLNDQQVPVYGDGQQIRDWIHVEDHCRGIVAAYENGKPGEVYNFGGEAERTNLQLTKKLLEILNKPDSLIKFVADRPGHDRRYAIDCSKARRELGWSPATSFEDGLARTVQWYQSNQVWVDHVKSGEYRDYYQKQYAHR